MEHREPIGRAYILDGWRTIYSSRRIGRGKKKGWLEVEFIDLRNGKGTYVKTKVSSYRTLEEGNVIDGREEEHRSHDQPQGSGEVSEVG